MADDQDSDALLADLNAQLAIIEPQIQGLNDFISMPVSTELQAELNTVLDGRKLRQSLILTVVTDLTALLANGYPDLPPITVPGSLFAELQEQNAALDAALTVFTADQIVAGPMTTSKNPKPPTNPGP